MRYLPFTVLEARFEGLATSGASAARGSAEKVGCATLFLVGTANSA
jgi:hypothetical protein